MKKAVIRISDSPVFTAYEFSTYPIFIEGLEEDRFIIYNRLKGKPTIAFDDEDYVIWFMRYPRNDVKVHYSLLEAKKYHEHILDWRTDQLLNKI